MIIVCLKLNFVHIIIPVSSWVTLLERKDDGCMILRIRGSLSLVMGFMRKLFPFVPENSKLITSQHHFDSIQGTNLLQGDCNVSECFDDPPGNMDRVEEPSD